MKLSRDVVIFISRSQQMDKTKALQSLLDGTASEEEIQLLKQALASGEISIGGNVNQSVIIIEAATRWNSRPRRRIVLPRTASEEVVEGDPPYMGLRYFDTADAVLFYRRESLTRELAARVANENFLAIVDASGAENRPWRVRDPSLHGGRESPSRVDN